MSIEERIRMSARRVAADVDPPDVDVDLIRSRVHSGRRRMGMVAAVLVAVAGGAAVMFDEPDWAAPPANQGSVEKSGPGPVQNGVWGPVGNGILVDSIGGDDDYGQTPPSELPPLTATGMARYPVWQAFDQDSGRFLFTGNEGPGSLFDSTATIRILTPGRDAPVATIRCDECHWPAFGPGPDEITALEAESGSWPPGSANVYGFDGALRDSIDVSGLQEGFGIADIAWSPDGTQLAVSTFTGAREPACPRSGCEARIYIVDRNGGAPVLAHRRSTPAQVNANPPLLQDLAWAPDGERLAMVSSTYYPEQADPPALVALAVGSGKVETLHVFDDCGSCNPARYGYAWSPDGTRIAVTSGAGITKLAADGAVLVATIGSGQGPLAWLPESAN